MLMKPMAASEISDGRISLGTAQNGPNGAIDANRGDNQEEQLQPRHMPICPPLSPQAPMINGMAMKEMSTGWRSVWPLTP
jgi:hypothetical protein